MIYVLSVPTKILKKIINAKSAHLNFKIPLSTQIRTINTPTTYSTYPIKIKLKKKVVMLAKKSNKRQKLSIKKNLKIFACLIIMRRLTKLLLFN